MWSLASAPHARQQDATVTLWLTSLSARGSASYGAQTSSSVARAIRCHSEAKSKRQERPALTVGLRWSRCTRSVGRGRFASTWTVRAKRRHLRLAVGGGVRVAAQSVAQPRRLLLHPAAPLHAKSGLDPIEAAASRRGGSSKVVRI